MVPAASGSGAATSLLGIIIDILTVSATKTAIVFLWRRSSTAYFKGTPS